MKILVINAGSSSLKYQLIDMEGETVAAKGQVERIGIEGTHFKQQVGGNVIEYSRNMKDHVEAIEAVMSALTDPEKGAIRSMDEISAVGHRVLHGGETFKESVLVTEETMKGMKALVPLGPLHMPANLMGIESCQKVMPNTPNVAVFDTAFHQTMPPKAYLYAIPYDYYKRLQIRRYGFHGTSHRFVSARALEVLGLKDKPSKIVICHLGNGSSLSACVDGKCFDTSMGLTPLEGVLMGTRSGDLDPAVVECIANNEHLTPSETLNVLNKKSGLLGLSGVSSDMRDVRSAAAEGNAMAKVTLDIWAYRIRKYIGAYAAAMGGLDAIIFTAGIGENDGEGRAEVLEGLEFLGVKLDAEKNAKVRGVEAEISAPDSKVKVWVIPTNEELAIARDTLMLTSK